MSLSKNTSRTKRLISISDKKEYHFSVSVVLPVYNAEEYVARAVESAVNIPEVAEVILIEDNSPDDSLAVCKRLELAYGKVRLYQHQGGGNKGAGASRNLGIKKSKCDYVAFLDADDFYLEHRFVMDREVFSLRDDVDGIYHAAGHYYYDTATWESWGELCTVYDRVNPEAFFESYLFGNGHPHVDALTVRVSAIERAGLFREDMRLHQDSEWVMRLAYHCRLLAGDITEPVAMIGVHHKNRFPSNNFASRSIEWSTKFNYFKSRDISLKSKLALLKRFIRHHPNRNIEAGWVQRHVHVILLAIYETLRNLSYLVGLRNAE